MAEECGLLNLPTCIVEKFFSYIAELLSGSFDPLLSLIKDLLAAPVDISVFSGLWSLILYVISFFYAFVFLYAGFLFILSGDDIEKRNRAKYWLERAVLMIVFVQGSYFIYGLAIELSSALTTGVLSMADPAFFTLTTDSFATFGLQFFLMAFLMLNLLVLALLLGFRYIIVSVGVVFFALGLFMYFFGPLEKYGRLIINFLGVCIFMPFFGGLIILTASPLSSAPFFSNLKIVLMNNIYSAISILFIFLMFFSLIKSVLGFVFKAGIIRKVVRMVK